MGTTRKVAKIIKPSLSDAKEEDEKEEEKTTTKDYFQNQWHKFISFVHVLKDKNKSLKKKKLPTLQLIR